MSEDKETKPVLDIAREDGKIVIELPVKLGTYVISGLVLLCAICFPFLSSVIADVPLIELFQDWMFIALVLMLVVFSVVNFVMLFIPKRVIVNEDERFLSYPNPFNPFRKRTIFLAEIVSLEPIAKHDPEGVSRFYLRIKDGNKSIKIPTQSEEQGKALKGEIEKLIN